MNHSHNHDPTIPRGALIGAAVLLTFVMVLTGAVSWGWIPQSANPELSRAAEQVAPAEKRDLNFADREDGAVIISDAATQDIVKVIAYGEGGFVRATMRRMARTRAASGIGSERPFTLIRWENGALSLHDPATGKNAEIHGFGADHSTTFAEMLKEPSA